MEEKGVSILAWLAAFVSLALAASGLILGTFVMFLLGVILCGIVIAVGDK